MSIRHYINLIEAYTESRTTMFFLRDTSDPERDLRRGFSCEVNSWFSHEDDAKECAERHSASEGHRQDPETGMWCGSPEPGLSSYAFNDESSFARAMDAIGEYLSQDRVAIFQSSEYDLGAGADGEDCFRNGRFVGWLDLEDGYATWDDFQRTVGLTESVDATARDGDAYFNLNHPDVEEVYNDRSRKTLVYMSPDDFLLMAEDGANDEKQANANDVAAQGIKFREVPWLSFVHDGKGRAQVIGHNGRHRARAMKALGIKQMPVLLVSAESGKGLGIRWGRRKQGFDKVDVMPTRLRGEDGRGTIPMPQSVIFP